MEEQQLKKQLLKDAVKSFNKKPSKGMSLLIANNFVENDAVRIAEFLQNTSTLSKSAIGEYIGDGDPFHVQVMV